MNSSEELLEALVTLQRENERLRLETRHGRLLLLSLKSMLQAGIGGDPFASVFDLLRDVFTFDQVMVFAESAEGRLECIVAEPRRLVGLRCRVGPFLGKIMAGRVSATFSNAGLEEWSDLPAGILSPAQPALYFPISVPGRRGVLVLLRSEGAEGFDRSDVALAREFALVASQALATVDAHLQIEKSRARAVAAEEASRAKSLFIANMSHELRTPLHAIIGFSEHLLSQMAGPGGDERHATFMEEIASGGRRLLAMVDDLLLFARIESGDLRIEMEPLCLCDQVARVLRRLQAEADGRGVRLLSETGQPPLEVWADRQALRQILASLVGNAIKFSPPGGTVRVAVAAGLVPGTARISVVDQGCGIPAETLRQLGAPFVQADSGFSRRHQGTGLGLAISFRLAEAMAASLGLESVDRGTTATLSLAPPPAAAAALS